LPQLPTFVLLHHLLLLLLWCRFLLLLGCRLLHSAIFHLQLFVVVSRRFAATLFLPLLFAISTLKLVWNCLKMAFPIKCICPLTYALAFRPNPIHLPIAFPPQRPIRGCHHQHQMMSWEQFGPSLHTFSANGDWRQNLFLNAAKIWIIKNLMDF